MTMTDQDIAAALLAARGGAGPARITVRDAAQAYAVQRLVAPSLGPIGGWKVGAAGPDAAPSCAPMPASCVFAAPALPDMRALPQREVESEICFTFAADLPPRATPYAEADVLAAIATARPGIEILQSRLENPGAAAPLALLADLIQHGAFIVGAPIEGWRAVDFSRVTVRQSVTGADDRTRIGNPAGDMGRLMVWLANEGAAWAGGIRAGQVVTCGSWTGKLFVPEGATVVTAFSCAAPLTLLL